MSVVVKEIVSSKIFVFTKGAVEAILQKVKKTDASIELHATDMAATGLRTLCFAYRELEPHAIGETSFSNLDWEKVADNKLEKNMNLLAVTGVEDTL